MSSVASASDTRREITPGALLRASALAGTVAVGLVVVSAVLELGTTHWGMLVAEGAVDGAVDAVGISEWDLAAVQVIVEEAGGRFSDAAGVSRIDSGTALTSNGLLHDELLAAIAAG